MSIFVYLSALLAMANCAGLLYSGFGVWHVILFVLALVLGALGLIMPGPDKADGRVVCVLAVIMASLPLLRAPIRHLRYSLKEKAYAKKIAPMAQQWKDARDRFSKDMLAWEEEHNAPPEFDGRTPVAAPSGQNNKPPAGLSGNRNPAGSASSGGAQALSLPIDPFHQKGDPCRYWTNSRTDWVLLSVGPDQVKDINMPPPLRPTDRADGRGRWIALNTDNFADLVYDPTNGSLGKGDLIWVDGTAKATQEFTGDLMEAWGRAMRAIGAAPPGANPAQQAGAAARSLYQQNDVLAALAAGTYSTVHIPKYKAQQSPPDFEGRLVQGEALYALGDPRMAAASLAVFVELSPNDPRGHYELGLALYYSGALQEARRELAAASQIDESDPVARPAYDAMMAITKGKPPPAPPPGRAVEKEKEAPKGEGGLPGLF